MSARSRQSDMNLKSIVKTWSRNPTTALKAAAAITSLNSIAAYGIQQYITTLSAWKRGTATVLNDAGLLERIIGVPRSIAWQIYETPSENYLTAAAVASVVYIAADGVQYFKRKCQK